MNVAFRFAICAAFLIGQAITPISAQTWQQDGNLKVRGINTAFASNRLANSLIGENVTDYTLTARFNLQFDSKHWSGEVGYQMAGLFGDTLEAGQNLTQSIFSMPRLPSDEARLFDLSNVISDSDNRALLHRLDRFNISYQDTDNVIKLGRQAVSWGNGLIYTPMDFFNPFDPAAIDTEYKPGEDMLYAQHLFANGDDVQMVWVGRRDENSKISTQADSIALKYHGFAGPNEFDLLIAEHYQDTILGVGSTFSVGGSIIRADWVVTDTGAGRYHNVVANISYSWVGWGKNISGSVEYFHNDFGIRGDDHNLSKLIAAPVLTTRLNRGELFTIGRNYLAGSAVVELAPLWLLTQNIFYNVSDNSAMIQIISQHDVSQNMQLVAALSAPFGSQGSEYGGFALDEQEPQNSLSQFDWRFYAQLAWYF